MTRETMDQTTQKRELGLDLLMSAEDSSPAEDLYKQTGFVISAANYGFRDLLITRGSGFALLGGGAVLYLYLKGFLKDEGITTLSTAYMALGAALFGIVLAGLAVVATFFDSRFTELLRSTGKLRDTLFIFWWVAALAVLSLLASVALTVCATVGAVEAINAVALTIATVLFVAALIESLALVGTMMRLALYRAELLRQPPVDVQARRGDGA